MRWAEYLCAFGLTLALLTAENPDMPERLPTLSVPEIVPPNAFSIEADFVRYAGENQYARASGNVVVINGDVNLRANSTTVDFQARQLTVSDGFVFNRAQQQIYGRALDYDLSSRAAKGRDVGMNILGSHIKGKSVVIGEDSIVIHDAYQTTCPNEANPCNHITAQKMTLYPEWGNMVNDHAVVYFFFLPVAYVPNSVADLNGDQDNTYAAIPKLGYNPAEGNYVKIGWSFYQNEKFNGTLDLHYLEKLGLRSGFTDNYKLSQTHRGQIRAHYLSGLGGRFSYGWQHRILLGVPQKSRSQIIDDFFRGILPPSKNDYPEFIFELVNREMIGYQWVTYRPKVALTLPAYEIWNTGLKYTFNGFVVNQLEENVETISTVGDVDFEDGTRDYRQQNWEGDLYRGFEGGWGKLTAGALYSDSTYFNGGYLSGLWSRLVYYVNGEKDWDRLSLKAGYKYTPYERGFSPFNAETFYAGTSEENNWGVGWKLFGDFKLHYEQYYSVTEHKIRDRVYGGEFKMHCWNVKVNWSEYYSQFSFGISMKK